MKIFMLVIVLFISSILFAQYPQFFGDIQAGNITGDSVFVNYLQTIYSVVNTSWVTFDTISVLSTDTIHSGDATLITDAFVQALHGNFSGNVYTDTILVSDNLSSDSLRLYDNGTNFEINSDKNITVTGNTTFNDSLVLKGGFYKFTVDSFKIEYTAGGSTQVSSKAPIYIPTEFWTDHSLADTMDLMIATSTGTPPTSYGRMFIDTVGTDSIIVVLPDGTRRGIAIE